MGGAEICLKTGGGGWTGITLGGERKICCDTSNKKMTFSDCKWYSNIGSGPASGGDGFCRPNGPNDHVRLAMHTGAEECSGGGKARCCLPDYSDTIEAENEKLGVWRDELTSIIPGLAKRRTDPREAKTEGLLLALITKVGSTAMLDAMEEIWNDGIGDKFLNRKMGHFRNYMKDLPNYNTEGPIELCDDVMCNPHYWNGRAGGSDTRTTNCEGICTSIDSCDLDETDLAKRLAAREAEWMGASLSLDYFAHTVLEKRAGPRPYRPMLRSPDGSKQITLTIILPGSYGFSDLDPDNPIMDEVVDFASRGDCTNIGIIYLSLPNGETFNIEHLFDGNVMGRFMADAARGRLRSDAVARTGPVRINFFRQAQIMPLLPGAPPLPGDIPDGGGLTPDQQREMTRPEYVLLRLRASIGMIRCLNHRGPLNINGRLAIIVNNVGLHGSTARPRGTRPTQTTWCPSQTFGASRPPTSSPG
ncbi:hypothetical protein DL765_007838 [Monosporascus sp. GIB2]|nr:hypothetical protein DL765_007838 [Monosporascus sp. GIB2]